MARAKVVSVWLVHTCILLAVLTPASSAAPPSDRCILIKVQVTGWEGNNALANMGLDIWEYREGGLIVRVTKDERRKIQTEGFTVETITEDVYEYLQTRRDTEVRAFAEPATATYHSYDEVIDELLALEASGVAQTYVIGNTHEGREIWAVRISDNPAADEDEPGALFFGCQHAREWIAVEVPLYVAQFLAGNYDQDAEVKRLVDNCEIWIVPVVNPDGYEYSRTTDRMWRKNRRDNGDGFFGVDLNRNWGYLWGGPGASTFTHDETYRGPGPFSEPETQAMRDLALAHEFQIMMDYHSYGQLTIIPWGHTQDPCPDYLPMSAMAFRMRELIQQTSGAIYTDWWEDPGAYVVSGGSEDWGYGELGIYAFSIELPPVTSGQGGFVLPESRILPACEENLPVALYLVSLSAANGGIENLMTGTTYSSIQFAVNDANDGDEILLDPGLYHESVYFLDKTATLTSIDPNDPNLVASTVIDGYHQDAAVTTAGHTGDGSLLAGLTVFGEAVGVACTDASPTIWNCTIGSNGPNAVEYWKGHEPTIVDCNILGPVVEVNDPRLIAHWKLDETEGDTAHDCVAGYDGTFEGGPIWQPDGGMIGGALQLDGVDDCIDTPLKLNPSAGPFSVLAWVRGGAPEQVIVSQYAGVKWLMVKDRGVLATELSSQGTKDVLASEVSVTDGDWHRVGLTWDGSARALYVDDIKVAEDAQPNLADQNAILYLGASGPTRSRAPTFFAGLIDDIRVYNRAIRP